MGLKFRWSAVIEVDEVWVADGFELTAKKLTSAINGLIPWARPDEIAARITKSPDPSLIRLAQGYTETTEGPCPFCESIDTVLVTPIRPGPDGFGGRCKQCQHTWPLSQIPNCT